MTKALYDVALSFANADRAFAAQLADRLRARGARVFFDSTSAEELWGDDLAEHLRTIYSGSRVCVLFLSKAYARSQWTMFEARVTTARAAQEASIAVVPLRLDRGELPAQLEAMPAIDVRERDLDQIADMIMRAVEAIRFRGEKAAELPEGQDYHVISRSRGWAVKSAGASRAARVMKTKGEAVRYARDLARRHAGNEVIVHGRDGSVERRLATRAS